MQKTNILLAIIVMLVLNSVGLASDAVPAKTQADCNTILSRWNMAHGTLTVLNGAFAVSNLRKGNNVGTAINAGGAAISANEIRLNNNVRTIINAAFRGDDNRELVNFLAEMNRDFPNTHITIEQLRKAILSGNLNRSYCTTLGGAVYWNDFKRILNETIIRGN